MVFASYLTTAFVVAGVSGWHLLKRRHEPVARKGFAMGLMMATVLAPAQIVVGDFHGRNVAEYQPMKVAAMEGLWKTAKGIPLILFAIPDQKSQKNLFEISIPKLSSLIITHDWNGEVKGLNEVQLKDQPPVLPAFFGFRVMVGIGFFFLFVAALHVLMRVRRRMYDSRWLMRFSVMAAPLGFIAVWAGWIVAETGRQPFTVYGLLRTEDSVSPVTAGEVATSLILFFIVYGILSVAYLIFLARLIRKGPEEVEPEAAPEAVRGARASQVVPKEDAV
jgi:cytochrome d ubiquinol oxidase subunit I